MLIFKNHLKYGVEYPHGEILYYYKMVTRAEHGFLICFTSFICIQISSNKMFRAPTYKKKYYPLGKIAEKAVCRSVFLTIWQNALLQTVFLVILPTGFL